jgi:hypothetical protein
MKDEWIHNQGNMEAGKLHDGTEIPVSDAFYQLCFHLANQIFARYS